MDDETLRMLVAMLEELGRQHGTVLLACRPGRWVVTVTRGAAEEAEAHQGPRGEAPALRDALPGPHAWLCPSPPEAPEELVPG